MTRLFSVILIMLCLAISANAQTFFFRKYGVQEGLPRSGAYSICEDKDGFLWIGIDGGGVAIFDGYDFELLDEQKGLPSLNVRKIIQDSQNRMWLGTTNGVHVISQTRWWNIGLKHGLTNLFVRSLAEDANGNIWVATSKGIFVVKDSIVVNTLTTDDGLLHNKITSVLKDKDGMMWTGSDDGIVIFDKNYKKVRQYTIEDGLAANTILCLFQDSKGHMWAGTNVGMACITKKEVVCFTDLKDLTHQRVRAIAEDKNGNLWFGTFEGLTYYNGREFVKMTRENGLIQNRIRDIATDRNGDIWLATHFGGISRYSSDPFTRFGIKDGLPDDNILALHGNGRNLLAVASPEGISLVKYKSRPMLSMHTIKTWPKVEARAVYLKKDSSVWAATQFGLVHLSSNSPKMYGAASGMISDNLFSMLLESDKLIWVGSSKGVSRLDFSSGDVRCKNYPSPVESEWFAVSYILRHSNGKLYAGTREGGLYWVNESEGKLEEIPFPGLKNITCMRTSGRLIIIATDGFGIIAINPDQPGKIVQQFTRQDKLVSDHIYLIEQGKQGEWWAGTQRGIDRITTDFTGKPERVKYFGDREGFFGLETTEKAVFIDNEGILWTGTIDGLVAFNPFIFHWNTVPPIVHLKNVYVNGSPWHTINNLKVGKIHGRFQLPDHLTLDYNQNNIIFSFTGINLAKPNLTRYRWKLDGFENEWNGPYPRRDISYTNLPPGEYTLLIEGINEDGHKSEAYQVIAIEILPAFWQTTWFMVLAIITGIILTLIISQWRVRKVQAAKEKLENIVNERTLELRKEKELVEQQNEHISAQREALEEFNKHITDSINYARRIQSAMMKPAVPQSGELMNRTFILYQPKDIVSGDFFWYSDIESCTYITAADCTGHGVPGALMSMIGIAYLNEIMRSHPLPSTDYILNQLRTKIIDGVLGTSKDGMDMALCRICWKEKKVQFSGANNPLWVVNPKRTQWPETTRPLAEGLMGAEFRPDKMPIGEHDLKDKPFTLHEFQAEEGDMIYLFSDGYADQFGGDRGKKLMYRRFKDLLLECAHLPVKKQMSYLDNHMQTWMSGYEQVDDILVIGIRF